MIHYVTSDFTEDWVECIDYVVVRSGSGSHGQPTSLTRNIYLHAIWERTGTEPVGHDASSAGISWMWMGTEEAECSNRAWIPDVKGGGTWGREKEWEYSINTHLRIMWGYVLRSDSIHISCGQRWWSFIWMNTILRAWSLSSGFPSHSVWS